MHLHTHTYTVMFVRAHAHILSHISTHAFARINTTHILTFTHAYMHALAREKKYSYNLSLYVC